MTRFEALVDYAYCRNVDTYSVYSDSKAKGCSVVGDMGASIVINKSNLNSSAEEFCTLAEEIGHIESCAVLPFEDYLNPRYKKYLKKKNEKRAESWAINKIIPAKMIQEALDDCCYNNYEIAEYCGVSEDFLHKAFEYYNQQGVVFKCAVCF